MEAFSLICRNNEQFWLLHTGKSAHLLASLKCICCDSILKPKIRENFQPLILCFHYPCGGKQQNHCFCFLPSLVLTFQRSKCESSNEFHSIDGCPVGQYVLESQLAEAVHGKACSKSYQTVAGEQSTEVVREVALREEETVKNFHTVGVVKHAEESLLLLLQWKSLCCYFSPFQELAKAFILNRFCWQ